MTVKDALLRKNISEVLHFTTNRGLVGALAARALLSRAQLPKEKLLEHVLHLNSQYRAEAQPYFDKQEHWLDFVNLSISAVNSRFFSISRRWHLHEDIWWTILSFDSVIATHDGVRFATTNNSYEHCERGHGEAGFEQLFKPSISCKGSWVVYRKNRPSNLPTCEQAEILYPRSLSIDYLRKVYVANTEAQDIVVGWLEEFDVKDVHAVVEPSKFEGIPNR
ncbi:DarT ssDNA thymidine ADP-ribosyltransferase family protein [Dyella sp. SG609]|uniref:DarT ssDNA thymidine ADP-ribosyltransferase family protein n=1 Tax=Dyella sp. SG609 TaxID=2587018 RepID=UPI0014455833|nr:DarT ssDNA thymidine ADP-ribosyltransferase family protein [Dyella sp. SG609]NKJ23285.1 hypothetical protein [Dyella sp. SG609]